MILAPVVKGRKGHYRELFEQVRKQGFLKVRIDGEVTEITHGLQLDRYKIHDIEIMIDQLVIKEDARTRLVNSVNLAMRQGKSSLMVLDEGSGEVRHFSRLLMCPTSGISYEEPEPNTFSFNSPYGACPKCNGLGTISEIDISKIIPDRRKSIKRGGIVPIGEYKNSWIFKQIEAIGEKYGFDLNTPIEELPEEAINVILYGSNEKQQGIVTVKDMTVGREKAKAVGNRNEWLAARPGQVAVPRGDLVSAIRKMLAEIEGSGS